MLLEAISAGRDRDQPDVAALETRANTLQLRRPGVMRRIFMQHPGEVVVAVTRYRNGPLPR